MNRRDVVRKFLLGGTVLMVVPSVLESCSKSSAMDPGTNTGGNTPGATAINLDLSLAENAALNTSGSSKVIQNILIINNGTKIIALSAICTHQGCTVAYNAAKADIECPCHGSVYSTSGSVLVGPASSPLRSYPVTLADNLLTINL